MIWLRKQNEKLKKELEDFSKKDLAEDSEENVKISCLDYKFKYNGMCKAYNLLQKEFLDIKKNFANNLCYKCKAVTERGQELSNKIDRIRAYIDIDNAE